MKKSIVVTLVILLSLFIYYFDVHNIVLANGECPEGVLVDTNGKWYEEDVNGESVFLSEAQTKSCEGNVPMVKFGEEADIRIDNQEGNVTSYSLKIGNIATTQTILFMFLIATVFVTSIIGILTFAVSLRKTKSKALRISFIISLSVFVIALILYVGAIVLLKP